MEHCFEVYLAEDLSFSLSSLGNEIYGLRSQHLLTPFPNHRV